MLTPLSLIGTADLVRTGVAEEEEQQVGSAAAAAALGAVGVCLGVTQCFSRLIASNLRVLFGVSSWQQSTEILAWDEGSRRW
uniref:Uncharacterized protein n=1 Tax=Oryza barthii TaxID=65489 RepID=A0A0D3FTP1_9ORYZ